jgi:polyisoprenoid-binding protein YceI
MFQRNSVRNAVFGALVGLAGVSAAAKAQSTYDIDSAHSSAQFSVRHLMISNVKGEFTNVTGTIVYDPANVGTSTIDAVIDVNTISTREPKRDAHLKSPDFFDAAKFPKLTFHSKQVWKANGVIQVKGDLTLHGVTREVVLTIDGPTPEQKDPWGSLRFGATATTKINRKDWGLTYNKALEAGGVVVGEEVSITIDLEAVKRMPASNVSSN